MENTTDLTGFPAERLGDARDALAKIQTRLVRAALKAGQVAPAAPELTVVKEYIVGECPRCKARYQSPGSTCNSGRLVNDAFCALATVRPRAVLDLVLVAAKPALAGWEFLAVVEPLGETFDGSAAGNLLRQVPGATVATSELEAYRSCDAAKCDHCKARRKRTETFVVRADGTTEIPAGTLRQVGRQCLADFLGGKSPASILASLSFLEAVREAGGGDGEGGYSGARAPEVLDPVEFLTWTVSVVRLDGWVSKGKAASDERLVATANTVNFLLTPQFGPESIKAQRELREKFAPTDEDAVRAVTVLEWARALVGSSDYETSLTSVARQAYPKASHGGILASAVAAYDRATGQTLVNRRVAAGTVSAHVGELGKRIVLTAVVERVASFETQYGMLHANTLRDAAGNALVWKTGSVALKVGETVTGKCTVKKHSEWKGEAQTELSRCSF